MDKEIYDFLLNYRITKYPSEYDVLSISDQNEVTKNVNFVIADIKSKLLCEYAVDKSLKNLEGNILKWYDRINDLKTNKKHTVIYDYLGEGLNDIYLSIVKIWLQDLYFDYINKFMRNK